MKSNITNKVLSIPVLWRGVQFHLNHISPRLMSFKAFVKYNFSNKNTNYKKILPTLGFEPSNICNAKCVFCAYRKTNDKKVNMTFDDFKKYIDEFKVMGGKSIWLTPVVGEALVDPKVFEKIEYAKTKDLLVQLYSNGTLLNFNGNYKKLVDSKIDTLAISLSDMDYKIEAKNFGIDENLAKSKFEGIRNLLEYNKEKNGIKNISLSFRSSRKPYEIMRSKDFLDLRKKYNFEYNFLLGYDNWGGSIENKELRGIMQLKSPVTYRKYPCIRLYNAVTILSNGNVRLCACRLKTTTDDDLVVGNIKTDTLKNILENDKVNTIRKDFVNGKYPEVCKGCSFYEPYFK